MSKFITKNTEYKEILRAKLASTPESAEGFQNAIATAEDAERIIQSPQKKRIITFIANALTNQIPVANEDLANKFVALINGLAPDASRYILHIMISEYFYEFDLEKRVAIEKLMVSNDNVRNMIDYENPATETRIADMLLPTAAENITEKNRLEMFHKILSKSKDVNLKNQNGETALSIAAKNNIPSIVKSLFDKGATIEAAGKDIGPEMISIPSIYGIIVIADKIDMPQFLDDIYYCSTLCCISSEKSNYIQHLHKNGHLHPMQREEDGYSLNNENIIKILKILIDNGLDIQHETNSGSVLSKATVAHTFLTPDMDINTVPNTWLIERILDLKGIKINSTNESGQPYIFQAFRFNPYIAQKIINMKEFDHTIIDQDGNGMLHMAAALISKIEDAEKIIPKLIEKGCNINLLNKEGKSPAFVALSNGKFDNALYLAKLLGPDAAVDNFESSLMHISAILNDTESSIKMIQKLIEMGYDINLLNKEGKSPAFVALSNGKFDNALYLASLLEPDAVIDDSGNTLIHLSTLLNRTEDTKKTIQKLIERGYDINAQNDSGATPLLASINNNKTEVVTYLLKECNADPEIPDYTQISPAILAASLGNIPILESLNKHEAPLNKPMSDINPKTPFDIAISNGRIEAANFIAATVGLDNILRDHGITPDLEDRIIVLGVNNTDDSTS